MDDWAFIRRVADDQITHANRNRLIAIAGTIATLRAEVERLTRERDALRDALGQAGEWFGEYAASHEAKGATEKAQRNQDRADFCGHAMIRAALTRPDIAERENFIFDTFRKRAEEDDGR